MVVFFMAMIEGVGAYHKGNADHQVFKAEVFDNIHPK